MIVFLHLFTASRLQLLFHGIFASHYSLRVKEETKPSCCWMRFWAGNQFTNADRNFYFCIKIPECRKLTRRKKHHERVTWNIMQQSISAMPCWRTMKEKLFIPSSQKDSSGCEVWGWTGSCEQGKVESVEGELWSTSQRVPFVTRWCWAFGYFIILLHRIL